ncbi:MAG: hypothetical protein U0Y10_03295 [Spirosomataceae bacterium]
MKNHFFIPKLALLFLLSFLLINCERNPDERITPENDGAYSITIQEAQDWYESRTSSARISGAETPFTDWRVAFSYQITKNHNVVVIPYLLYDAKNRKPIFRQLWIYKDKNKKNTGRIIEYLNDSRFPKQDGVSVKHFSGYMFMSDLNGKAIGGFVLKDSKPIGFLKPQTPNARVAGYECGEFDNCKLYVWEKVNADGTRTYIGCSMGCYTDYGCFWAGNTGMSDNPNTEYQGGGQGGGDSGGGTYIPYPVNPPAGGEHDYKFGYKSTKCAGYKEMYDISKKASNSYKEVAGFLTTSGEVIILPTVNNEYDKAVWATEYKDQLGNTILTVEASNGFWIITTFDFSDPNTTKKTSYTAAAMVHTHACDPNYDYMIPSSKLNSSADADIQTAVMFSSVQPSLKHFILTCNHTIEFSGNAPGNGVIQTTNDSCR